MVSENTSTTFDLRTQNSHTFLLRLVLYDDLHRHSVITWRVNTPKDKAVSRAVDVKAFYSSSSLTQMLGESEPSVTELFVHSHTDPSTVKSRVNKGQCEHGEYTQVQVFLCHLFSVFLLQSEKI